LIRLPANDVLYDEIKHLLIRPVGRPSRKPVVWFHDFKYRAASWHKRRRVVAKVEQWIKEGKYALNWTRLSCKHFLSNQVRLGLFVLAYNLGNFLRRLVLPGSIKHWSLRTLLVKLIKIGAKVLRHSRYVVFQMTEVAISKEVFAEILSRINRLRCCSLQ